jgi:hypothetical protein
VAPCVREQRPAAGTLDHEMVAASTDGAATPPGVVTLFVLGESMSGANLLKAVVAPSARIQLYVQMRHGASRDPCASRSTASRDEAIVSACRIRTLLVVGRPERARRQAPTGLPQRLAKQHLRRRPARSVLLLLRSASLRSRCSFSMWLSDKYPARAPSGSRRASLRRVAGSVQSSADVGLF